MLVLRRKEGEWIEITHGKSGDVMRFRVYDITDHHVNIAFEDEAIHFDIQRPERFLPRESARGRV